MALNNNKIWTIINHIARKELKGNIIAVDKRGLLLQVASRKLFEDYLEQYERTKKISKALIRFRRVKHGGDLSSEQDSDGSTMLQLPSDFGYLSSIAYKHTTYGFRPIVELADDQWYVRLSSDISTPSARNPVCRLLDHEEESGSDYRYWVEINGIDYNNRGKVRITYLKTPTEPVYAYTYDDDTDEYTYNSSGSTELDWREEDKYRIVGIILANIGITLSNAQIFQYAKMVEAES
jgi:hypothetical protein